MNNFKVQVVDVRRTGLFFCQHILIFFPKLILACFSVSYGLIRTKFNQNSSSPCNFFDRSGTLFRGPLKGLYRQITDQKQKFLTNILYAMFINTKFSYGFR